MHENLALANTLEPDTIADLVATLRYLKRQFELRGELDEMNVKHIDETLMLVERDCNCAAEGRFLTGAEG